MTKMEINEFFDKSEIEEENSIGDVELDVQKAVVESLAADKAMQDEQIESLRAENSKPRWPLWPRRRGSGSRSLTWTASTTISACRIM